MTDGRTRARRDRDAQRAARPWYRRLGPGLLAGASDDDPSSIAVNAQAGSQFGFHQLWLPVVVLPMMVAVQLAAACVGRGRYREGVVAAIRRHYSARLAKTLIAMVVIVNVVSVGADLSAMGDATALVAGGRSYWYAPINPFRALYWSAVLNGVAAVPMLVMVMRLSGRPDVVGRLRNGRVLRALGWLAVVLMAGAVGVMCVDLAA